MIYSVGYQRHTPSTLLAMLRALRIESLIDVRSSPTSRKPGFSRKALSLQLGQLYEWLGDRLGGRGTGPTTAGLTELEREKRTVMLMCLEEAPGDCHRHHMIGVPLAANRIDIMHVYRNELFTARALQRAIENGDEYDCTYLTEAFG